MNKTTYLLTALATLATTLPVAAQTGPQAASPTDPQGVARCQAMTSDLARLGCYDQLAKSGQSAPQATSPASPQSTPPQGSAQGDPQGQGKVQSQPPGMAKGPADAQPPRAANSGPAPASMSAGPGGWLHREATNGLDRSTIESAILPATSGNVGLINKPGLKRGPALVIRCKEKQTAVFITFDLPVTGSADTVPVEYRIGAAPPTRSVWGRSQDDQAYGFWDNARAVELARRLIGQDELYVRASPAGRSQSEAGFKLAGIEAALQPVRAACGW